MKHKFFKQLMGVAIIATMVFGCQTEDGINTNDYEAIKTVSIDQAKEFLASYNNDLNQKTTNEDYIMDLQLDYIIQEGITNSNEQLTIIPVNTINHEHYSRLLLLEIDGNIQSVVFSMYANNQNSSQSFSGEIIITDLDGNFLNGYRMVDGVATTKLQYSQDSSAQSKSANTFCPDHGYCTEGSQCIMCEQQLEEVVIVGGSGETPKTDYFVLWNIFDGPGGGGSLDFGWDSGISGGGGSGTPIAPTDYQQFLNGLTPIQQDFLASNISLKIAVQEFFSDNGHTTENEAQIIDLINYLMLNPFPNANFEYNPTLGPNDAIQVDSIEDIDEFFDNLLDGNFTTVSSEINGDDATLRKDVHKMSLSDGGYEADIASLITVKVPDPNNDLECLEILHVKTVLDGNSTLLEWTQLSGETPATETNPEGSFVTVNQALDSIKISIFGRLKAKFNLAPGITIIKDQLMTVEIVYDYSTGELNPNYSYWHYTE